MASLPPERPLIEWLPPPTRAVRANPDYELRPLAALPTRARRSLGTAARTDGIYGVLLPRNGMPLLPKLIDVAAARLVEALRDARPPPREIVSRVPGLVLEGILECDGPNGFVSGAAALDDFADECAQAPVEWSSSLAGAALEYAERLRLDDVDMLTSRLYGFYRSPSTRRWWRRFDGPDSVREMIPAAVRDRWISRPPSQYWMSFVRPGALSGSSPYKVYVSPAIDELPDVLAPAVDALASTGALRFKVGANAAGLLRPDKFVVYVADAGAVDEVASALHAAIGTARTHGVPFSAPLDGSGLLSWGGDPPPADAPVGRRSESWRLSVCRRLAEGLVTAGGAPRRRIRAIDYALTRLGADGVDVRTFAPTSLLPPRAAAGWFAGCA